MDSKGQHRGATGEGNWESRRLKPLSSVSDHVVSDLGCRHFNPSVVEWQQVTIGVEQLDDPSCHGMSTLTPADVRLHWSVDIAESPPLKPTAALPDVRRFHCYVLIAEGWTF